MDEMENVTDVQAAYIKQLRAQLQQLEGEKDLLGRGAFGLNALIKEKDARIKELEEITDELNKQNDRLFAMFKDDIYIEHATLDPGYYNLCLRGKGAMLIMGSILQIFRDSGGENFLTNTMQMTLPDGKTREMFELTIQKVDGEDSPAQKIQRLEADLAQARRQIEKLEAENLQLQVSAYGKH